MKKVLVTGAGGGIGKATVKKLSDEGYFVIAQYRNRPTDASETVIPVYGDFSTRRGIEEFYDRVKGYGRLYGIVNLAGIAMEKLFSDCTDEEIENMIYTDLTSAILLTKRFVPQFVSAGEGSIINVSSIWGRKGASCEVAYSAAKGGMIAFTKALSREIGLSGVRVNCVAPGLIDTEMNAGYTAEEKKAFLDGVSLGREGKASEVADIISYLLSEKSSYVTGQTIGVDGGI